MSEAVDGPVRYEVVPALKLGMAVAYWPSALERSRNSTLDVNRAWVGIVTYVYDEQPSKVNLAVMVPFPDDPLSPVERRLAIEKQGEAEGGNRCWSFLP